MCMYVCIHTDARHRARWLLHLQWHCCNCIAAHGMPSGNLLALCYINLETLSCTLHAYYPGAPMSSWVCPTTKKNKLAEMKYPD